MGVLSDIFGSDEPSEIEVISKEPLGGSKKPVEKSDSGEEKTLPDGVLTEHRRTVKEKERKWREEMERARVKSSEDEAEIRRVKESLRRARKSEYEEWLAQWLEQGNSVSHCYNYPWSRWDWYFALEDFSIKRRLCGANSMNIIVPSSVEYEDQYHSHNNIYIWDGERADKQSGTTIATFNDLR